MANKISELTEKLNAESNDLIAIVDETGTPTTKRVKVSNLLNMPQTSSVVFNADGTITDTLINGATAITTFNSDGTITTVYSAPISKTKTTTFNSDGSITEVIT